MNVNESRIEFLKVGRPQATDKSRSFATLRDHAEQFG
jgi:hypothetical protein